MQTDRQSTSHTSTTYAGRYTTTSGRGTSRSAELDALGARIHAAATWMYLQSCIHELAHYLEAGVDPSTYSQPDVIDDIGNAGVELYFTRGMAKCLLDDAGMQDSDFAVIQIFASGPKRAVIQRDADLLTEEEIRKHKPAVEAAISGGIEHLG